MSSAVIIVFAVVLDAVLGDPQRWHPLVGFGKMANWIEYHSNYFTHKIISRFLGTVAVIMCILPTVIILSLLEQLFSEQQYYYYSIFTIVILYFTIAAKSLLQHAERVYKALKHNNIDEARIKTSYLVSRNTQQLGATALSSATIESVLENGNDAVFAALFWFLVAGAPAVVMYRLSNTLDAMWGYRSQRFQHFGWFAARLDDLLNFIPARLTALSYAVCGNFKIALRCWIKQAPHWQSPNAGPVMASGAGALSLQLGGAAWYHGRLIQRHKLGIGLSPKIKDIARAKKLVQRSLLLWLTIIILGDYFV